MMLERLGRDQLAERMPGVVRPALEPDLREREPARRRRVDDDARQDERIALLVQMYGRVHHALPGQVLSGLLERVDHRVGGRHSCGEVAVLQVARVDARPVLLEDRLEELDALVVTPEWR